MKQQRKSVRRMLLLAIASVVALEASMADEPKASMAELVTTWEPVPEDAWDFKKQFPQTYDSPLHGTVYLAAGQVDPNAPEPLTEVPVFMAFKGAMYPADEINVPDPERVNKFLRSAKVTSKLSLLFVLYTTEDVSIPGFDVNARYGAIVSYDEDGVRHYELISFKLIRAKSGFPVAMPGVSDHEVIATVPIE